MIKTSLRRTMSSMTEKLSAKRRASMIVKTGFIASKEDSIETDEGTPVASVSSLKAAPHTNILDKSVPQMDR